MEIIARLFGRVDRRPATDDLIGDEGLVSRLVDRATSEAAMDEALRRVGSRSDLLTVTYIKVLKEWGY